MKKLIIILLIFVFLSNNAFSQRFAIEWQQCYGGSSGDGGEEMIRLADSTYIIFGGSGSDDGDISFAHGENDIWLVKTDSYGNLLWEKTIGGSDDDSPNNFYITTEGNYIISGETFSNDGDISGNHGGLDYWVAKTDSLGNIIWQRCLGSSVNDYQEQMVIDDMGNIYVIGGSHGDDGDITDPHGFVDFWIVKLNTDGELLWDRSLGGTITDWGQCISPTPDGGYIVGGATDSPDGDVECENTSITQFDMWIVKLDSLNNIQWQQCYGGSEFDNAIDIKTTDDGGYIIAGITKSNDGDVSGFHGVAGESADLWIVKIDNLGTIEWQRCLGGTENEGSPEITIMEDGSYLINAHTYSNNGDVSGNHSYPGYFSDGWLVKLSNDGELLWQQCFGSLTGDGIGDVYVISDTEMMLVGGASNQSGDVECDLNTAPGGYTDLWMFKIVDTVSVQIPENIVDVNNVNVYPNPAKDYVSFEIPPSIPPNGGKNIILINNVFGQVIAKLPIKNEKTLWNTRNIKPGIYFYNLNVSGFNKSGKIVISN